MAQRDDVITECRFCDDRGIATSTVTGARGVCRHPFVRYHGHEPESETRTATELQRLLTAGAPTMGDFSTLDDAALSARLEREAVLLEGQGKRACGGWCADGVTTELLREAARRTAPNGSTHSQEDQ